MWRDIDYVPEYSKLYYILDGEGWLKIGDKEYYPNPGQLFLMPQGVRQSYAVISEHSFTKMWCHFTAKTGGISLFDLIQTPYFIDVKDALLIADLFTELHYSASSPEPLAPLTVQSCLLRLLSYFLRHASSDHLVLSKPDRSMRLHDVLAYIENHYAAPIAVNDLARIAHLHPNYFIRLFRKSFGASPMQYINNKRIEEAKKLLLSTDLTLKEISQKTGMTEPYYLSRVFKEHTGFSPSAYKQLFK
ncbi:AraC family transcriptional regulator [Cohnella sp. GCM10012308]|uniref:AraC family transcriptional regulator n=1 Tax=Cohnella sp. GCM10012308 TaxID=3317329 RepID=UPI00360A4438